MPRPIVKRIHQIRCLQKVPRQLMAMIRRQKRLLITTRPAKPQRTLQQMTMKVATCPTTTRKIAGKLWKIRMSLKPQVHRTSVTSRRKPLRTQITRLPSICLRGELDTVSLYSLQHSPSRKLQVPMQPTSPFHVREIVRVQLISSCSCPHFESAVCRERSWTMSPRRPHRGECGCRHTTHRTIVVFGFYAANMSGPSQLPCTH